MASQAASASSSATPNAAWNLVFTVCAVSESAPPRNKVRTASSP
jgi:hypothetical protein